MQSRRRPRTAAIRRQKSTGASPLFTPAFFSIVLHVGFVAFLFFGQEWLNQAPKKRPEYRHIKAKVVQLESKNVKKESSAKKQQKKKEQELLAKKKAAEEKRKAAKKLAEQKRKEAEKKRLAEQKRKAEEKRLLALKKKKEQEKKDKEKKEKERLAKEKAEKLRKQKEEEKRLAELEKKKQLEKKRKEEERKRLELERQKLEQEQLLAELEAEELAIQQDLSDEQAAMGYVDQLREEIYRAWRLPPNSDPSLVVGVRIRLVPTGEVVSVAIINSSGNDVLDRSVEQAVKRASPLSVPKETRIFDKHFRSIMINFRPVGV